MLGSYINNSYNRLYRDNKEAFDLNPIRPNEDLETYINRSGAQYQADRNLSAEQRRIAMDPNKSKYMSPREKEAALSEYGFQKKYGAFQIAPMGGGGGGGGGRENARRSPQGIATYNPGKSEDLRNSTFDQWKTDKAKVRGTGGSNW